MKTKAKLTLAISVLSAVVLSAGVTSTFAWFTTRATAKAAFSTLTVNSPSALSVTGYRVTDEAGALTPAGNGVSDASHPLGSVSSINGKDFFAPVDLTDEERGNTAITYALVAEDTLSLENNPYCGFYKANLLVKADKGEDGKALKVTVANNTTGDLADAIRVALYSTSDPLGPDTPETVRQNANQNVGSVSYVFGDSNFKTGVAKAGAGTATGVLKTDMDVIDFDEEKQIVPAFTSVSKDKYMHFVVAIWLEGTKAASQNDLGGQAAAVDVTFSLGAPNTSSSSTQEP